MIIECKKELTLENNSKITQMNITLRNHVKSLLTILKKTWKNRFDNETLEFLFNDFYWHIYKKYYLIDYITSEEVEQYVKNKYKHYLKDIMVRIFSPVSKSDTYRFIIEIKFRLKDMSINDEYIYLTWFFDYLK